jgi:hypothetical protein
MMFQSSEQCDGIIFLERIKRLMTKTSQLPTDTITLGNATEWFCYFKEGKVSIKNYET